MGPDFAGPILLSAKRVLHFPSMPGRLFLLWLIAISFFSACNNGTIPPSSNCNPVRDTVLPLTITFRDTLNLYLDSLMVMGISTPIDYHETGNVLYTFDSYNKRLLEYPLTGKPGIIHPQHLFPIVTKQKISYFRYISPDTLILYAYGGARLFYYSISQAATYKELAFIDKHKMPMKGAAAPPFAKPGSPLFFTDNKIIGVGFLIGEKENDNIMGRTIAAAIDVPTGNVSYHIPYSKVYWLNNWGGSHLRTPYATYNEQTGKIVLSLPADHNIQVIDSAWQIKELYAGTRKDICITSMPLAKSNKKVFDATVALEYFTGTPSYRNIMYDPYHERYYRILELPPAKEAQHPGKLQSKKAFLIAFDKDFRYLGEAALPDAFALDNFFITAAGLYFLDVSNQDQNIAQYVQCNIEL